MLNYIWAGLIISALVFALINDGIDISRDTYRNGRALPVTIRLKAASSQPPRSDVDVIISSSAFESHFGVAGGSKLAASYPATLVASPNGSQVIFAKEATLPEPLLTIRDFLGGADKQLNAVVADLRVESANSMTASLQFEPVRFLKLRAMTDAAFEFAKQAVMVAV